MSEENDKVKEVHGNCLKIDLTPNWNYGYFLGLTLGDGSIWHSKRTGNYYIQLESTNRELVNLFREAGKILGLHPTTEKPQFRESSFSPKKLHYRTRATSKVLFSLLRPLKLDDSYWKLPSLPTKESRRGFLAGLFDAEGSVSKDRLDYSSKHVENLEQLLPLLKELELYEGKVEITPNYSSNEMYRLKIFGKGNRIKFSRISPKLKVIKNE